jgi:hypothetical protein
MGLADGFFIYGIFNDAFSVMCYLVWTMDILSERK